MNLKESFEQWKKGKFVHKYPDEPETLGGMGVMRDGEWVQPWVVYMAKNLLEFAKANWDKIILSTCAILLLSLLSSQCSLVSLRNMRFFHLQLMSSIQIEKPLSHAKTTIKTLFNNITNPSQKKT